MAFSCHDESRSFRTERATSTLVRKYRSGPGVRRRVFSRIRPLGRSASPRTESHTNFLYRWHQCRQHSWRGVCQRCAAGSNYSHLPHDSVSRHWPMARFPTRTRQQSPPRRSYRASLRIEALRGSANSHGRRHHGPDQRRTRRFHSRKSLRSHPCELRFPRLVRTR
jgi:hypothetical protein